jgi:hypothetical protein
MTRSNRYPSSAAEPVDQHVDLDAGTRALRERFGKTLSNIA